MKEGTNIMDAKDFEKQAKEQQAFIVLRQSEVAACQAALSKAGATNITVSRSEMGCDVPLVFISMPGLSAHVRSNDFKVLKSFDLNSVKNTAYWIC